MASIWNRNLLLQALDQSDSDSDLGCETTPPLSQEAVHYLNQLKSAALEDGSSESLPSESSYHVSHRRSLSPPIPHNDDNDDDDANDPHPSPLGVLLFLILSLI